jgi:hypothetical protein
MNAPPSSTSFASRSKLAAALDSAERGFRVIPLKPNSKKPILDDWPTKATRDKAKITNTFYNRDYNYGNTLEGYAVVDIDIRNGGARTWNQLAGITKDTPKLREDWQTLTAQTATGGLHLYYKLPPGVTLASGTNVFGPGI